ncbi:MAG: DUF1289 domain-containing protein [Rhodocyclaceae bacterium]|nr:DUF1289 domain-containing protein [Rhodocyclaceae bacterium]
MTVESPCTKTRCRLDFETGICQGCFRTADEILAWPSATDEERLMILAAIAQRRSRIDPDADMAGNCAD